MANYCVFVVVVLSEGEITDRSLINSCYSCEL